MHLLGHGQMQSSPGETCQLFPHPGLTVSSSTGQALCLPGPLIFKEIKVRSGC